MAVLLQEHIFTYLLTYLPYFLVCLHDIVTNHIVKKLAIIRRDTALIVILQEVYPAPTLLLQNPSPYSQLTQYFRLMLSPLLQHSHSYCSITGVPVSTQPSILHRSPRHPELTSDTAAFNLH